MSDWSCSPTTSRRSHVSHPWCLKTKQPGLYREARWDLSSNPVHPWSCLYDVCYFNLAYSTGWWWSWRWQDCDAQNIKTVTKQQVRPAPWWLLLGPYRIATVPRKNILQCYGLLNITTSQYYTCLSLQIQQDWQQVFLSQIYSNEKSMLRENAYLNPCKYRCDIAANK